MDRDSQTKREGTAVNPKLVLDRPIVVEGKYDKIRLSSLVEGTILCSDGFGIFKAKEKAAMIRRIAQKNGIIVLTDPDGGGLVIRNYFRSILPRDKLVHLYIPMIPGKERRKDAPSREGLLGVEGMDTELLHELLLPYAVGTPPQEKGRPVTRADLYEDGLMGGQGSAEKRKTLCRAASLPDNLSTTALLEALNLLYDYREYQAMLKTV